MPGAAAAAAKAAKSQAEAGDQGEGGITDKKPIETEDAGKEDGGQEVKDKDKDIEAESKTVVQWLWSFGGTADSARSGDTDENLTQKGVLEEFEASFKTLSIYSKKYDEEYIAKALSDAKDETSDPKALQEKLQKKFEDLKEGHETETKVLAEYRTKFRALQLPTWTDMSDAYIHNLLLHAKHKSTSMEEMKESLALQYEHHRKKHRKLSRKEKLQVEMMLVYADLRREWRMSMADAKDFLHEQCRLSKFYLDENPTNLVGKRVEVMELRNRSLGTRKRIEWLHAECLKYDKERLDPHLLKFDNGKEEWIDLRGRIFELDDKEDVNAGDAGAAHAKAGECFLKIGDRVDAQLEGGNDWCGATITAAHRDSTYSLTYDNGEIWEEAPRDKIIKDHGLHEYNVQEVQ
jgi:hypothetical protein